MEKDSIDIFQTTIMIHTIKDVALVHKTHIFHLLAISFHNLPEETWLTHDELYILKYLHPDLYADGVSAMDTSCGMTPSTTGLHTGIDVQNYSAQLSFRIMLFVAIISLVRTSAILKALRTCIALY